MVQASINKGARILKTKTNGIMTKISVGFAAIVMGLTLTVAPAAASSSTIYNNIPNPQPGNLPSQAFEATSTSEFGGQVSFAGTARQNPKVTVLMSSWGCQSGHWYSNDCSTTPGSTFSEDVTLNIYNVNGDNSAGTKVGTVTKSFNIPYRPSVDPTNCPDSGRWYSTTDHTCYNGFATPISFDLNNVNLPGKAIVSVAYDTSHFGYNPIGENTACYTSGGGCGYDSLNVALTAPPTVGSNPLPNDAYLNSSWNGAYCDNGTGGTGAFRLDQGCWTGYQPAIKVEASVPMPTSKDQCKDNGWKSYGSTFKNQGDCVSFVATNGKNQPSGQ